MTVPFRTLVVLAVLMGGVLLVVKYAGRTLTPAGAVSPYRVAVGADPSAITTQSFPVEFWNGVLATMADALNATDSLRAVVVAAVAVNEDERRRQIRFNFQSGSLMLATATVAGSDTTVAWTLARGEERGVWETVHPLAAYRDSVAIGLLADSVQAAIAARRN